MVRLAVNVKRSGRWFGIWFEFSGVYIVALVLILCSLRTAGAFPVVDSLPP